MLRDFDDRLLRRRRCETSWIVLPETLGGVELCAITDENHVRFWPDRRRWHLWVSFPSLEASSNVSSFASLAWCWQWSLGESLDSVMDRYDGGTNKESIKNPYLAKVFLWSLGESLVPMVCSSGVRRCPNRSSLALCMVVAGDSETVFSSGRIESCHPLATSFRH